MRLERSSIAGPRPAQALSASKDLRVSSPDAKTDGKARAIETRALAHVQAHLRAGGTYSTAPRFQYEISSQGNHYVSSGEVGFDREPIKDIDLAAKRADVVEAAALAPADPSPEDVRVALANLHIKLMSYFQTKDISSSYTPSSETSIPTEIRSQISRTLGDIVNTHV